MRATITLPVLALAASAAADCNGKAAYCNLAYSKVTFAGSHNSGFVGVGPSDNQLTSVSAQLNQGIRFLTTQTHDKDGVIEMCHTVSRTVTNVCCGGLRRMGLGRVVATGRT
jgi:hypothetical protein